MTDLPEEGCVRCIPCRRVSAPLIVETDRSLLSNITAAWIGGALDLQSVRWYLIYQLMLSLAAIAAPFFMPAIRHSMTQSRLMFVMIAGGPTVSVLFAWVAGYDAVFVLGAVLAALACWVVHHGFQPRIPCWRGTPAVVADAGHRLPGLESLSTNLACARIYRGCGLGSRRSNSHFGIGASSCGAHLHKGGPCMVRWGHP